jgi:transposase
MPKAYSSDVRERVIARVESGASREAAEDYDVSPSTAITWVKCFRKTGRRAAKPRGGSTSPLEQHSEFLLALIESKPDLTLDEVLAEMRKNSIPGSRTAVWGFFQRHKSGSKKGLRAAEQERSDVATARRRWMREKRMFDPARLVFIDQTAANTKMPRLSGRCRRGERLIGPECHSGIGKRSPLLPL